jgi:hypothetical protein
VAATNAGGDGFTTYPNNGLSMPGLSYFHSTTPFEQTGQSILYCLPNSDGNYGNSSDEFNEGGGMG